MAIHHPNDDVCKACLEDAQEYQTEMARHGAAIEALRRNGVPVTEEAIQAFYVGAREAAQRP